jgi:MSHA biogenesis protein MshE
MAVETSTAQMKTQVNDMLLGEVLVKQNCISQEHLEQTLKLQQKTGQKLGSLLVEANLITDDLLASVVARKLHLPLINIPDVHLRDDLVLLLPEAAARKFLALVIDDKDDNLLVAMQNPLDQSAIDGLSLLLKRTMTIAEVPEGQLMLALDEAYQITEFVFSDHMEQTKALEQDLGTDTVFLDEDALLSDGAPVARLLLSLFEQAIGIGASDLHLEPQKNNLQVRLRVDGMLQGQLVVNVRSGAALGRRVKLLAGLDITETRIPQDGGFNVEVFGKQMDVRVSTLPSIYGESVVMRILSQDMNIRRLDELGMPELIVTRFKAKLKGRSGLVLVTGPTGSGKTTSLSAALLELDTDVLKVISVEDPVEYRLAGITQIQVNEKIDLTFSKVLRSIVRQDPDVLLVGEIRDVDTAEICLRSAMTGHMVLSTLHTNDAMTAPFRLINMEVQPFMLTSALHAIIAQRLVRLNCVKCSEPHIPTPLEQSWLDDILEIGDSVSSMRGLGCPACSGTGYSGRRGVYEWLEMDADLINAILRSDPITFMMIARERMKGRFMAHNALELVRQGLTSLAEAQHINFDPGEEG